MSQIAAVLAPTVLPSMAGALVRADTATAQGETFAQLLAQFRSAVVTQLAGGGAAPDTDPAMTDQTLASPGQPTLPRDVVQATPPAQPLSPLDILALPPSKPRTDPDAIDEGGAAIVPPDLALLEFVFPAAQAQTLPDNSAAAPKSSAAGISALGLRGALLPEPPVAVLDAQAARLPAQTAQPAGQQTAQPTAEVAQTQPAPAAARGEASDAAIERTAAPVALLTAVSKLKPVGASQSPGAAKPAAQTEGSEQAPVEAPTHLQAATSGTPAPQTLDTAKPAPSPERVARTSSEGLVQPQTPVQAQAPDQPQTPFQPQAPTLNVTAPQAPNATKPAERGDGASIEARALRRTPAPTASAAPDPIAERSARTQDFAAQAAPPAPSAPPASNDASATNTPPQPLAAAPARALSALIDGQAVNTAVAAAPQAGVPIDALAVNIARKFQEGSSQFELRLHPLELGRLDISLTVAEDGRVQAVLRAERPETLDMLQRDARVLEQQLRQAGLEVGSNALSFSLSNGNGQRQAPFAGWPAFADAQNIAGAAKEEAASTYIAVRARDGIDIRV